MMQNEPNIPEMGFIYLIVFQFFTLRNQNIRPKLIGTLVGTYKKIKKYKDK